MQQESQRIEKLELDFVGVKHEMSTNSQTLKEIKEILVKQSDILSTVTYVREAVTLVKESVKALEETFEKRKEVTEQNNRTFLEFMNRSKGALGVCLVLFSVIQGFIISEYKERETSYRELQADIEELEKDIIILQSSQAQQKRISTKVTK